jgi:UDP-N-acetylglucosamine acyltransferase
MPTKVHSRAIVDAGAELGDGVEVGPGAVIEGDVVLGAGVRVMANAVVCRGTRLGDGCQVHPGAVIGGPPQDTKYQGERSFVEVGAGCVFREFTTVNRGTGEGTVTRLGAGCMLMSGAHVGHNCTVGDGVIMVNSAVLGGHVEVGAKAFLSGNTSIHQFCRVGRLAMLGGNAAMSLDLPPFMTGTSTLANRVCGLNTVGLRRAGVGPEARKALKQAYHLIIRSEMALDEALASLGSSAVPEVLELVEFYRRSKRGAVSVHETMNRR